MTDQKEASPKSDLTFDVQLPDENVFAALNNLAFALNQVKLNPDGATQNLRHAKIKLQECKMWVEQHFTERRNQNGQ